MENKRLSDREKEVFTDIAGGKRISQIAVDLGISVKTVATYRARVLRKLGLRSNAEIAVAAYKLGLVQ